MCRKTYERTYKQIDRYYCAATYCCCCYCYFLLKSIYPHVPKPEQRALLYSISDIPRLAILPIPTHQVWRGSEGSRHKADSVRPQNPADAICYGVKSRYLGDAWAVPTAQFGGKYSRSKIITVFKSDNVLELNSFLVPCRPFIFTRLLRLYRHNPAQRSKSRREERAAIASLGKGAAH